MISPLLADALAELYAVPPEQFVAKRAELVMRLTKAGENEIAGAIRPARKPTVAAWIVNNLIAHEPGIPDKLAQLGARLHAAQDALDADQLRALSGDRRQLVSQLCRRAFELAQRRDPPATLLDEVRGTFDAAVADPDVVARLGRLVRAEQWSGFGFGADGLPQLTLVRGGGESADEQPAAAKKTAPKETAAQRRQRLRRIQAAQHEFDQADADVMGLQKGVADEEERVARLEAELTRVRGDLDFAKEQLTQARTDLARMKKRRQQARRDLDRAEREQPR